jgi:hypothetical protein
MVSIGKNSQKIKEKNSTKGYSKLPDLGILRLSSFGGNKFILRFKYSK